MLLLDLMGESKSNIEIHNPETLDKLLVNLCQLVVAGQKSDPHRWGVVAAAVIDHKGQVCHGINYYDTRTNDRVHAERAALDSYYHKFGIKPTRGSIMVTTCSPCSEGNMIGRYAQSCTDLLNEAGIQRVYAGFQDPSQPETKKRFSVTITDNPKINQLCERFARTFL